MTLKLGFGIEPSENTQDSFLVGIKKLALTKMSLLSCLRKLQKISCVRKFWRDTQNYSFFAAVIGIFDIAHNWWVIITHVQCVIVEQSIFIL